MISLMVVFYMFLVIFAIIGGLRGWAKEMLVIFSVVLALFLIFLLEKFEFFVVPFESIYLDPGGPAVFFETLAADTQSGLKTQFWIRTLIVITLVFFGYQTPGLSRFAAAVRREKVQDFILGVVFGLLNGYLVVGTIWSFMDSAQYPFSPLIVSPAAGDPLGEAALRWIALLPPLWLGSEPGIYVAVGLAFLFVLVVFI
ncbi:MAG: hypothetical protein JW862_07200 [Anaerolineales bacterium]|nr:hypothetical protein [Anaerolineales bacterium]